MLAREVERPPIDQSRKHTPPSTKNSDSCEGAWLARLPIVICMQLGTVCMFSKGSMHCQTVTLYTTRIAGQAQRHFILHCTIYETTPFLIRKGMATVHAVRYGKRYTHTVTHSRWSLLMGHYGWSAPTS